LASARVDGLLVSWNDERGFGFVQPADKSANLFVHVSAFGAMAHRPEVGDVVSYRPGRGKDGRAQALDVHGPGRLRKQSKRASASSLVVVLTFIAVVVIINMIQPVPSLIVGIYVVTSIVTFAMYGYDKTRATSGRWRVPETTLLLLGLIGGWPGAVVGQLVFRHKTTKESFRSAFWVTVVINVLVFGAVIAYVAVPAVRGILNG
jgi:uncharacterized membrane protein YsdA (DUF1294 family)/cold shock CspA family protein